MQDKAAVTEPQDPDWEFPQVDGSDSAPAAGSGPDPTSTELPPDQDVQSALEALSARTRTQGAFDTGSDAWWRAQAAAQRAAAADEPAAPAVPPPASPPPGESVEAPEPPPALVEPTVLLPEPPAVVLPEPPDPPAALPAPPPIDVSPPLAALIERVTERPTVPIDLTPPAEPVPAPEQEQQAEPVQAPLAPVEPPVVDLTPIPVEPPAAASVAATAAPAESPAEELAMAPTKAEPSVPRGVAETPAPPVPRPAARPVDPDEPDIVPVLPPVIPALDPEPTPLHAHELPAYVPETPEEQASFYSALQTAPEEPPPVGRRRALLGSLLAVAGVALGILALFLFRNDGSPTSTPAVVSQPTAQHTTQPSVAPSAVQHSSAPPSVAPKPTTAPVVAAPIVPVTVLNNSRVHGLAHRAAARFSAGGWPTPTITNYTGGTVATTTVYYAPGQLGSAKRFAKQFGISRILPRFAGLPGHGLTVVITRDYRA